MRRILPLLAALAAAPAAAAAEPLFWGVQAERLEYRFGEDADLLEWDVDAFAGTDELRAVWRSKAEYATADDAFEALENQLRLETPVSEFFNLAAGVSVSTPAGPDRVYGVVGLHGLSPQWFEIDADLFLSDRPFARLDMEYEALITNRLILVPSVEVDLPLRDDAGIGAGAWAPTVEVGARLGYDLVGRTVSPYVGVHYERAFGESGDLRRADGEARDALYLVLGARMMF